MTPTPAEPICAVCMQFGSSNDPLLPQGDHRTVQRWLAHRDCVPGLLAYAMHEIQAGRYPQGTI